MDPTEWMDEQPYPGPEIGPTTGIEWSSEFSDPIGDLKAALEHAKKAWLDSFVTLFNGRAEAFVIDPAGGVKVIWPRSSGCPPIVTPPTGKPGKRPLPDIQRNAGPYSGDFQFDHRGRKRY